MKTIFFNGIDADHSTICLAITHDGKGLEVFTREDPGDDYELNVRGWTQQGVVSLGTHRLFRPEHDAQFTSDTKVWKPESKPRCSSPFYPGEREDE